MYSPERKELQLATAISEGVDVNLTLIIDGKPIYCRIRKTTVASLIYQLAKSLTEDLPK